MIGPGQPPPIIALPRMPALDDLAPFVSVVLLKVGARKTTTGIVADILKIASDFCVREQGTVQLGTMRGGAVGAALVFTERRPPSWWPGGLDEVRHHHLIVVARNGHVALCSSDGAFRDRVASLVAGAGEAEHVTRKAMTIAFVGSDAKTAWLNGIHTPSAVKADANTLSGKSDYIAGHRRLCPPPLGQPRVAMTCRRST